MFVLLALLCIPGIALRAQDVPPAPPPESVPAQPEVDPAKKKPAPATEAPAGDTTAAATEKSPTENEATTPAEPVPAPGQDASAPATDTVASAQPEAKPAPQTEASSPEAVAPAPENVATVPPEAPAPVQQEVAPVAETVMPPPAEPAPVPEPSVPVPDAVVQAVPESPAPASEATAPTGPIADTIIPEKSESAPAPEPAAPVVEAPAPAPEAVASVPETTATPLPEALAPVAEAAPAPTAPALTPEAPAPEPVVPAPEATKPVAQEEVRVPEAPASIPEPVAPVAPVAESAATPTPESRPEPDATDRSHEVVTPAPATVTAVATEAPAPVSETPAPTTDVPALAADAAPAVPTENIVSLEPVPPAPEAVTPPAPETVIPPAPEAVAQIPTDSPTIGQETAAPVSGDGSVVAVDRFAFSYGLAHPALPSLDELNSMAIPAVREGSVIRGPAAGGVDNLTLGNIPIGSRFDADALRTVAQEVVRWYNNRGLYGVWVTYRDIEASAAGLVDNRSLDDARVAHLVVWASQIADVRTLARGKRIKPQFSINNRKHRGIIKRSPLRPGETPDQPGSLFNQDVLNEYLFGLNHTGRRVEASISSYGEPGKVVLDYLVNESKAWQLFSQVNNFGTKQTGELRARLGFQHNQLTNHDDILNVDVISTEDFKTYGAFLSYRIPLWRPAKLLMRIYGSYGDYVTTPGDVTGSGLHYTGNNRQLGIEFSNRFTFWQGWQLISILGANHNHYAYQQLIGESTISVNSSSDFLVPFLGTTLSRDGVWWTMSGSVRFDHTVGDFANPDTQKGFPNMGRQKVEPDWTSARWNLSGSLYLDHWFRRGNQFQTLAHELSGRVRGRQLLRGNRLIPQEQEPIGGALTVRGYPESVLAADETLLGSIEYAYHIPRGLKPGEVGTLFRGPFKWRPTKVGQNPDWDLAIRAFYDYGHRGVNPPPPINPGATTTVNLSFADTSFDLSGAGLGLSLSVKQNFFLRADYGIALSELRDPPQPDDKEVITAKGNKQLSVVSTFIW